MNTIDLREICSRISDGKLSEIIEYIQSNYEKSMDHHMALSILITVCKTVSEKITYRDGSNDIYELLVICSKNLSNMKNSDKEKFLLCLYHVIKAFCNQKLFNNVLTFIDFIKQYCVDENYKTKTYSYYIIYFHNHMLQNAKDIDSHVLQNIILFSLQIQTLHTNFELDSFIPKVKLYSSILKYPHVKNEDRNQYLLALLQLFKVLPATENPNDIKRVYEALFINLHLCVLCIPNCETEYFPTFIHERTNEIIQTMEIHCCSKDISNCIRVLKYFSIIIQSPEDVTDKDIEILAKCNEKLKSLIKNCSSNLIVVRTCCEISKILRILFKYFQNFKSLWNKCTPCALEVELLKMIEILGQFLSKNSIDIEECCDDCEFDTDIYQAALITSCSGIFVQNSIRLQKTCTDELHNLTVQCLKDCCKYVNKMKTQTCKKYVPIWRIIGAALYNIAVVLYRNNEYQCSKSYLKILFTNIIALEGVQNADMCFQNSLGASLHLYGVCCSFLKERKESMIYLALCMLYCSEYRSKALQSWIILKLNGNDDEIKAKTISCILHEEEKFIKNIYPAYAYNAKDCEELLMDELTYYMDNWPSKIPIINTCNELCSVSDNVINRTKCFAHAWKKVITVLNSEFVKNLEATIDLIKTPRNSSDNICLSVLYFILYQSKMQEIIKNNLADMNETYIPLKNVFEPHEEPPNPNDKCDIVPAFYNLKIDNLLKIYDILENCIDIWNTLVITSEEIDYNLITALNIYHFIEQTAYEYRLQHLHNQMLKSWILLYKFGKKMNNTVAIVKSIGFIIEYANSKSKLIQNLEKEAEELLDKFNKKDVLQLDVFLTYYINKSNGYLKNDLIEKGYSSLCIAEKYFKEGIAANMKIIEARLLHLKTCYLHLPCVKKLISHNDNFLLIAQTSFTIIAEYFKEDSSKCPYLLSVLFEISLFNGWIYKWLRLPREVRCYTKESILLAQKYVLPIRTAQFLSLLAFTDLLDMQYSDCEVKLSGLTKILCYGSNTTYEKLPEHIKKSEKLKAENHSCEILELDPLTPMMQTVLDISVPQRSNKLLQGSPNLRRKPFKLPKFVKHSDDCDCFKCLNCEYQKLILDAIHLEALMNIYQGMNVQSEEYFNGGLKLYDIFRKKSASFSYKQLEFAENEAVLMCSYQNMSQSYYKFLLDYSYFLTQRSAFSEAKKVIDTIFKLVNGVKCINIYFWNELMTQKFNIYMEQEVSENNVPNINSSDNELQILIDAVESKTPENKISTSKITVSVSPVTVTNKIKPIKKLTFNISNSDTDSDREKQKTPECKAVFKFQTPAKTPALPKIKIYTPKTVKPKRTKSSTSVLLPVADSDAKVKKSINKQLGARTKLLTEKLKAEKTVLKDHSNIDNQLIKEKTTDKSVRKKLIEDLNEIVEVVDKLSINPSKIGSEIKKQKQIKSTKSRKEVKSENDPVSCKKYNRIKIPSSTSDSSSGSDEVFIRKSMRTKRT